jgi:fatty acid desaturase
VDLEGLSRPDARASNIRTALMLCPWATAALLAWFVSGPARIACLALACVWGSLSLVCAFAGEHEALHNNLYARSWVNSAMGVVWGMMFLNPYAMYRPYHLWHHSHTHAPSDSEVPLRVTRLVYLPVVIVLVPAFTASLWVDLVRSLVGHPPPYARHGLRRGLVTVSVAACVLVVAAAALALSVDWRWALGVWVVPLLVSSVVTSVLTAPEHLEAGYGPAGALATTRSTVSNRFVRAVWWNANFHAAHHLAQQVTGKHLGRVHGLVADRCTFVEPSFTSFYRGLVSRLRAGEIAPPPPWSNKATR